MTPQAVVSARGVCWGKTRELCDGRIVLVDVTMKRRGASGGLWVHETVPDSVHAARPLPKQK